MKKNIKIKTITFVSFLILILLFTNIYISYTNINNIKSEINTSVINVNNMEWEFIYGVIEENIQKSEIQGENISKSIKSDIDMSYKKNINKLKNDMKNLNNDCEFQRILKRNVDKKYLNVDNDNNDIWVMLNDSIIFDKTLNDSKDIKKRSVDKEISMHKNKNLAKDAMNKIINKKIEYPIFWENLNNKSKVVLLNSTKESLKNMFLKEGVEGFKNYEFLVPTYINKHEDIFNVPNLDNLGNKNNNNCIVITQTFNIYDQLMKTHKVTISNYDNIKNSIICQNQNDIKILQIETILFSILIFVTFISIVKIENFLLKDKI